MSRFKILDYIIFIAFAALVAVSAMKSLDNRNGKLYAEVNASGKRYIFPLDTDKELVVEGPAGETLITIADGRAGISDSDCPNKTCVAAGTISYAGSWVACLPNQVFVRIISNKDELSEGGLDAGVF